MSSQTQGKAILFIDIKDDKEQDLPKFEITHEAMKFLQSLGERKVSVLTIAGPQRSGKSFLANRIIGQQKGFEIGPTTNPCTKGIWLWNQPIVLENDRVLLLMDTEGLNSVERNQTIDTQIFSLSILLSSMFVYNNLGHIDESAIQNLALVVKLSENICVKQLNEEESILGQYSPNFLWVLRDFSLDLKGKSPKEYLEQELKSQIIDLNKPDMAHKNEIRDKLRQYFPRRDCICMVRPLQEENKLRRIEEQDWSSLRPEFRAGVQEFEKKVKETIPVKKIGNQVITGKMFLNLTLEYLDSINSGGIPMISNSLDRVRQTEVRRITEDLRKNYKIQVQKMFPQEQMPFQEEDMVKYQKIFQEKMREFLYKQIRTYIESDLLIEVERELLEFMDKEYRQRLEHNAVLSKSKCTNILKQIHLQFQVPNFVNLEDIKPMDVRERQQQFIEYMREYFSQAKGPFKFRAMAENGPILIFDFFFMYIEKLKNLYQEEINKLKIVLTQSRESEDRLRKIIADYEKTCDEIQVQASEYKSKYEKTLNEKQTEKKKSDYEINLLNKQVQDLKQMMTEQSESDYDGKQSQRTTYNDDHISEIKAQNEIVLLKEKIKMMENLINEKIDGYQSEETLADQYINLKELTQLTANMREWFKKKLSPDNNHQFFMESLQRLNDEKSQYMKKFNDELKTKKQQYKQQLEAVQQLNDKRFKHLHNQMDELKQKNLEMSQKLKDLNKKEQQITNLVNENISLQQNLAKKTQTIEAHKTALACQKIETEKHDEARINTEQRYAQFKAEQLYLTSVRQTYPYILSESLKLFQKKKNHLQTYFKQFQQEDKQSIIQVLKEFGITLDQ